MGPRRPVASPVAVEVAPGSRCDLAAPMGARLRPAETFPLRALRSSDRASIRRRFSATSAAATLRFRSSSAVIAECGLPGIMTVAAPGANSVGSMLASPLPSVASVEPGLRGTTGAAVSQGDAISTRRLVLRVRPGLAPPLSLRSFSRRVSLVPVLPSGLSPRAGWPWALLLRALAWAPATPPSTGPAAIATFPRTKTAAASALSRRAP